MSGAGNHFAVIDGRSCSEPLAHLAKRLCAATNADGFMALGHSQKADLRLHFYNSDGSRAALCGNGLRCICRFAYEKGLAGPQMTVETDAGVLSGSRLDARTYRVQLPRPPDPQGDFVTVGVPHVGVPRKTPDFSQRAQLLSLARKLRQARNANIDFYAVTGENSLDVLTYERGVENFTAACGTGSAAVALLHLQGKAGAVSVRSPGGTLSIEVSPDSLFLTGPTEILDIHCRGDL